MINVLVQGYLKESIITALNKQLESKEDFYTHSHMKANCSYQVIILDLCSFSDDEESEIENLKELHRLAYIIVVIEKEYIPHVSKLILEGIINDYVIKPVLSMDLVHRVCKGINEIESVKSDDSIKESLFTREAMLQTITDHLLDVICQVDQHGNFIYISNSSSQVFGYDLKNLNLKKVVHPDDEFKVIFALKSLQAEAVPLKLELRFRTANSKFLWVEAVGNPLCDHEYGICYGFIFALRNITDRKKMEDALKNTVYMLEEKQTELEEAYQDIKANIEKAHLVQKQFFPSQLPMVNRLSMFAFYSPAQYLGGDYYNAIQIDDEHIIFYLTDVSGHALDGAMLNIFIKNTIDQYLMIKKDHSKLSPKDIIHFVGQRYHQENFSEEYFVCIILAVLHTGTMKVTYSNSGFQTPLLVKEPNIPAKQMNIGGLPITTAIDLELLTFEEASFFLPPGSTMMVMTDGIVEQMSKEEEMFGAERFEDVLNDRKIPEPLFVSMDIQNKLMDFTDKIKNYDDDVTYFILHHSPSDTSELSIQSGSMPDALQIIRERAENFLLPIYENAEEFLMYFHELVANAVEHGNKFDENKVVTIRLFVTEDYISTTITDEGNGFDWRDRLSRPFSIDNFEERGRGIMISKLYFDEIAFNELGNQISFIKIIRKNTT